MPAIAAVTYVAAWAAGLAVWPVNLPINAAGAQVAASYQAHPAQAVAQYLLAEGLAGLLLGVVLAFAVFSRHRGPPAGWQPSGIRMWCSPVAASDGRAARRGYHGLGRCIPDAVE
jgi:hypothetical protein